MMVYSDLRRLFLVSAVWLMSLLWGARHKLVNLAMLANFGQLDIFSYTRIKYLDVLF